VADKVKGPPPTKEQADWDAANAKRNAQKAKAPWMSRARLGPRPTAAKQAGAAMAKLKEAKAAAPAPKSSDGPSAAPVKSASSAADHGAKFQEHTELAKKYEDAGDDKTSKLHSQAAQAHDMAQRVLERTEAYPDNAKMQSEGASASKKANAASDTAHGNAKPAAKAPASAEEAEKRIALHSKALFDLKNKDDPRAAEHTAKLHQAMREHHQLKTENKKDKESWRSEKSGQEQAMGERERQENKAIQTGSKGGRYYLNANGEKTYVK
jgi:colicin import membrane protein